MIRPSKRTAHRLRLSALIAGSTSIFTAYGQQLPAGYGQATKTLSKQSDFEDTVLTVNIPRNDLKVNIDGIATPMAFGFGAWLATTNGKGGMDVMMGGLVLLEDEVNPVTSALLDHELEVGTQPAVYFLHDWGTGPAQKRVTGFRAVLNDLGNRKTTVAKPAAHHGEV